MTAEFQPVTPVHITALRNLLGFGGILVDLNKVDYTRGRLETSPGCYSMWTVDKKRIDVSTVMHGEGSPAIMASQTRNIADDWPKTPAFPENSKLHLKPCINPFCNQGQDGKRALVDRNKKKSGACCKACINYECTHPDCVKRAQENGWPRATHPWETKIAELHKDFRANGH